jgi:sigma-B regulation protein RsbU (phosphoserine phosphatase)
VHPDETEKARVLLSEIRDALQRVDEKTYGACVCCDGTVELHRLEVQPARQVCLSCISKEEQNVLEEELFLASRIHRALLPQEIRKIDGFDLAVRSLAAHVVGGDYYDILPARNGGLTRVVVADSMGKGLPAGLVVSNLQGALRILAEEIDSPAELLNRLNHWLCRNIPVTNFITLACLGIEGGSGPAKVRYTNAGHPPPLLVHVDGTVETLDATGTVIGVHEDFTFEEELVTMNSGDLLLLYTDGASEAASIHGDMFGDERIMEFAKTQRDLPVNDLLTSLTETVLEFSGRPDFADDFTVLALRRTA